MFLRSYVPRFSIRQLLVWTAFIGFACVSLRSASEMWVAIAFAVVLMFLGATPMLVILRQGPERAYWLGFAVIGCLYLGLLMYSFALEPVAADTNPLSAGNLATARLARFCYDAIYGKDVKSNQLVFTLGTPATQQIVQINGQVLVSLNSTAFDVGIRGASGAPLRTGTVRLTSLPTTAQVGPEQHDFVNVTHALLTLLLATCGGWFARWLYVTGPGRSPTRK